MQKYTIPQIHIGSIVDLWLTLEPHAKGVIYTDLIVDWIEQLCVRLNIKNEAGTSILWVPGSKFMQQRTM